MLPVLTFELGRKGGSEVDHTLDDDRETRGGSHNENSAMMLSYQNSCIDNSILLPS